LYCTNKQLKINEWQVTKAKTKVEPIRPLQINANCKRCKLHESSRTVCCEGAGSFKSDLWLFGEALGAREEEIGRPFVGDAGFKLNYCLGKAKLSRKEIRVENVFRCRPPKNRKPSKSELKSCWGYSLYLILKYKPKVIVALGASAYDMLSGSYSGRRIKSQSLAHSRGFYSWQEFSYTSKEGKTFKHACWLIPTYHPAFCLRKWEADDLLIHDLALAKSLTYCKQNNEKEEPLWWPKTKVTVLNTKDEAITFLKRLRSVESFVADIEDTSLQVHESTVMCIGFCYKKDEATILPLHLQGTPPKPKWSSVEYREIIEELTKTLEGAQLRGQNIKYDIQRFRKLTGLTKFKINFDTMIAHHVIDENKPHNLTFLCQWYLRWKKYDAAIDPYKEDKTVKMWLVPDQIRHTYCGHDTNGTFQLCKILRTEIEKDKVELPYQIEQDLIVPLSDIEYRGVHIDVNRIKELAEKYRNEASKQLKILRKIALKNLGKENFNPNSPKQVIVLLEQVRAELTKKTKGGNTSVNKFVLAELALRQNKAGRIARALTVFRKMEKYVGTYLDGDTVSKRLKIKANKKKTIELLSSEERGDRELGIFRAANDLAGDLQEDVSDGKGFLCWVQEHNRIHPNYNQAIARTGRLSADDPPIQTIPRTGDLRSMLIPDVVGEHVLITVDYQKLEMCVMAWLANDSIMIHELLRDDLDIHTLMAITTRLMRNPTDDEYKRISPDIGKNERTISKGCNFGIPYGRGARAIAETYPEAFTLGQPMQQRAQTVQKVINAFLDKYYKITEYRERQIRKMHKFGRLRTTVHNRLRRFSGVDWFESKYGLQCEQRDHDLSHMEREALNCEIQSIGSDILSQATKRVFDTIRKPKFEAFRIIMSLHDALIFSIHKRHCDDAIPWIRARMETLLPKDEKHKYEMPIRVDCSVQEYWGQGEN
jgi:uracil-DNA glycosylase